MIDAWNNNMETIFSDIYIYCLNGSMMKWVNKYTCLGFIFVLRKP